MEKGYKKDIKKAGDGVTKPKKGDKVQVHYTGRLTNGSQFDSSVGGPPFEFHVGMKEVIRAWDEGVATMTVGEEALITAYPDFAYGAKGFPPVIPPNSTLLFDVKLLKIVK